MPAAQANESALSLNTMTTDWIKLKEAAALLHVNEKKLRVRTPGGDFLFYPELTRLQPDGPGTRLFLLRSEIDRRIAGIEAAAAKTQALTVSVRSLPETAIRQLKAMGASRTLALLR